MSQQLQMTIALLALCATNLSVAEEADVKPRKMFSSMGKELDVLNGYQEAVDKEAASFSAYRFHDEDPIFFDNGLRLTCRCGEELGGRVFHEPSAATYSTYAWVYQW